MEVRRWFAVLALATLVSLTPVLSAVPGPLVYAGPKPPGTDPPTVDGLLDDAYVEVGPTNTPNTPGMLYSYDYAGTDEVPGLCFYLLVVDRAFNDNVFGPYDGTVLDGWTTNGKDGVGHHFKDLEQSDSANLQLGEDGCTFWLDYIDREDSAWCAGTCGDAWTGRSTFPQNPPGCADDMVDLDVSTSMWYNLMQSDWGVGHDPTAAETGAWTSPDPLDYNCTSSDYYEWQMIYEFSIPRPAAGCPELSIADSHNSPSKEDKNGPGLARIGNYVWHDQDGLGTQDESGAGLADVCLCLKQAGLDGIMGTDDDVVVATTQTDAQGVYWFDYVEPGTYYVDPGGECISDGYCHTLSDPYPSSDGSIPDPPGDDPPLCGQGGGRGPLVVLGDTDPQEIIVEAGDEVDWADFGYDDVPTAVDLASFTASQAGAAVLVAWETASENRQLGLQPVPGRDGGWRPDPVKRGVDPHPDAAGQSSRRGLRVCGRDARARRRP